MSISETLQKYRIAHIGNIANNAYQIAKFLRSAGLEAETFNCDFRHIMAQPEWEDAEITGSVDESSPEWSSVDLNGYQRPDWFHDLQLKKLSLDGYEYRGLMLSRFYIEEAKTKASQTLQRIGMFRNPGQGYCYPATLTGKVRAGLFLPIAGSLYLIVKCLEAYDRKFSSYTGWSAEQKKYIDHELAVGGMSVSDIQWALPRAARLRAVLQSFDLIQAYGIEPIYTMLLSGGSPYVAFEHGTMRDIPFENSPRGRLLSRAYQKAAKVIITNPDVIHSARRLGLENIVFIPHPIDEDAFENKKGLGIGDEYRQRFPGAMICVAPARQNWGLKGNNLMIEAVSSLYNEGKDIVLLLARWGQEIPRTEKLIADLKLGERVIWYEPAHKAALRRMYQSVDVVLDQFVLGSFGGITPEAMAAGKPVLVYYDESVNNWCFPEKPPLFSVSSKEGIKQALEQLYASPALRKEVGEHAQSWVKRYHGREFVTNAHLNLYQEILEK